MINDNSSDGGNFSKSAETNIDTNRKLSDIILEEINGKFFQIDCLPNEGSRDYIRKQIDYEYDVNELIIFSKDICSEYGKTKRSLTGTNSKEGDLNVAVGRLLLNTSGTHYDDDVRNYTADIVEAHFKRPSTTKMFVDKNTGTQDEKQNLTKYRKVAAVRPAEIEIKKHSCISVKDSPPNRRKPIRCVSRKKFNINKRINGQISSEQLEKLPKCTQTDADPGSSVPNKNLENMTWHEMLQLAKTIKGSSPYKDSSSEIDNQSIETPIEATETLVNAPNSKLLKKPPLQSNTFLPGCEVQILPPLNISKPLKIQNVHKIEILPSNIDQHLMAHSNNRYIHLLHNEVDGDVGNREPPPRLPPSMELKSVAAQTNTEKSTPRSKATTKPVNKYFVPFINAGNRYDYNLITASTSSSIGIDDDQPMESEMSSTNYEDLIPIDRKRPFKKFNESSKRKNPRSRPLSVSKSPVVTPPFKSSTDEDELNIDFNKLDLEISPKLWLDLIEDVFSPSVHDENNQTLDPVRRSTTVGEKIQTNTNQIPISKTPSPICIVDFDHITTEIKNRQNQIVTMPTVADSVHLYPTESSTHTLKDQQPPKPTEQPLQTICQCVYCSYRIQPSCCPHQPTPVIQQQQYMIPPLDFNRIKSNHLRNDDGERTNYSTSSIVSSSDSNRVRDNPLREPLLTEFPSERYQTLKKSLTVPLEQTQAFANTLNNIYATAEKYNHRSHDELSRIGANYQEDYTIQQAADRFLRSVERERNSADALCNDMPLISARLLANSADADTLSESSSCRNIDFMCTNSEESSTECRDNGIEMFAEKPSANLSTVTSSIDSKTVESNGGVHNYDVYDSSIEYHIKRLKDFGLTPSRTSLVSSSTSGGGAGSSVYGKAKKKN